MTDAPPAPSAADEMSRRALGLLTEMDRNPEAKRLLEQAIKVVKPDHVTDDEVVQRAAAPMLSKLEASMEAIQGQLKEQADLRAQEAEARTVADLEGAFSRLTTQHHYTPEGIERIKTLMVERKIPDPEAAALLFDKQNPKPPEEAPGYVPQTWDMASNANGPEDLKLLFQDPDRWEQNAIRDTLNEIRLGKAA